MHLALRKALFNYSLRNSLALLGLKRWQRFVMSARRCRISDDGVDRLPPIGDFCPCEEKRTGDFL